MACVSSVLRALENTKLQSVTGRVMVVDNGSRDADLHKLKRGLADVAAQCPEVKPELERVERNLGFAAGMNVGIRRICNWRPDFFWLLNNDTVIDIQAISALLSYSIYRPDAVMLGCTMVEQSSERLLTAGGYRYFRWLGWNKPCLSGRALPDLNGLPTDRRMDYIDGAALWLRGNFIQLVGGIPQQYFLYFEELELNHYVGPGESIAWCPAALVYHRQGGSSSNANLQARAAYHAAFSAFVYTQRHYRYCLPTVVLARLAGIGGKALIRRQPQLLTAVLRAFLDFMTGRQASDF